jgi:hypothetical protein
MNDQDKDDACETVIKLWAALAADNDEAVEQLFVPYQLEEEIGRDALVPKSPPDPQAARFPTVEVSRSHFLPGSAARLRKRLGKSRRDCSAMEILRPVQPYENDPDACVVGSSPHGRTPAMLVAPVLLVTMLTVVRYERQWLLRGQTPGFRGETVVTPDRPRPARDN